jgi:hypothetical protein
VEMLETLQTWEFDATTCTVQALCHCAVRIFDEIGAPAELKVPLSTIQVALFPYLW